MKPQKLLFPLVAALVAVVSLSSCQTNSSNAGIGKAKIKGSPGAVVNQGYYHGESHRLNSSGNSDLRSSNRAPRRSVTSSSGSSYGRTTTVTNPDGSKTVTKRYALTEVAPGVGIDANGKVQPIPDSAKVIRKTVWRRDHNAKGDNPNGYGHVISDLKSLDHDWFYAPLD